MGFNYRWFKAGATTLPNQRVFNRYFKAEEGLKADDNFIGLELTKKLGDYVRGNSKGYHFVRQRERYFFIGSITGNLLAILAVILPICLGGMGTLACVLFFVVSMFYATTDFPMFFLYIVVAWNLFWLNMRFFLHFIFNRFKGAYIDREKQTISFTWRVKGNPEKNEFGHATFPLTDIEAFYSKQIKNQQGGSTYTLCLAHKDHYTYSGAFLQTNVRDNPHNPNHCQHKWELIQRFADNTLPLPDMPELEAFRHLDPLTVAYDKKHNRPEYHWRKMHVKHQRAIEEALEEMVHNFSFESAIHDPTCAKKELEKPWLIWPIEQKYFDDELAVPLWRKRAGVVFRQLTIGI